MWAQQSAEGEARAVIGQAEALRQRLAGDKRVEPGFTGRFALARTSLDEARAKLAPSPSPAPWRPAGTAATPSSRSSTRSPSAAARARPTSPRSRGRSSTGAATAATGRRRAAASPCSPATRCAPADSGSADILFQDGTLYTVRPNTQFIVSPGSAGAAGGAPEQSIQMDYGWVNLSTAKSSSNVKTPGAVARVKESSDAFVAVDKGTSQGRFGAYRGGMELASKGGLTRQVGELQQVVQTGDLLSEPRAMPGRPEPVEPQDDLLLDLTQSKKLVLAWSPVAGASRYALQISRNHLFVDNVIDAENRAKTRATLGLRGEGTFQWRVAAFGANGLQGPWSEPRKFRVVPAAQAAGGEKREGAPPELELDEVKTYGSIFMVAGRSQPGARIEVNGEPVKPGADGSSTARSIDQRRLEPDRGARPGRLGNETVRRQRVFVENP